MMENTNQSNYEDLFVDTTNNIAEKVNDSNDFYDDTDDTDDTSSSNSNLFVGNINSNDSQYVSNDFYDDTDDTDDTSSSNSNLFVGNINSNDSQYVSNEEISNLLDSIDSNNEIENDFVEQPITKLEFDSNSDMPIETEILDTESSNKIDDDLIVLDEPIELEDFASIEEPVMETEKIKDDIQFDKKEEFDPFELKNLTNDDMDKMIEEDTKKEELDDSYVLSNFDVLFDSLYNDVNGANNFISDLIEQKKNVNSNEATIKEAEEKLLKEKEEFSKYMEIQKESIEKEKEQCKEFVKTQKNRIQNEEEKFNNDMEAAREERKLAEKALKIEEKKLEEAKEQFEKYKDVEEAKLKAEQEKLEIERQQFEKEKEIEQEKIKNAKKELQSQKDQFARTKELEEKKLELESKNLSQSCARFKELVSQFNSGFQQLPEDK